MPINILGSLVLWAILSETEPGHICSVFHIQNGDFFFFLHAWVGEYLVILGVKPSELNPVAELEDNAIFMICMESLIYIYLFI